MGGFRHGRGDAGGKGGEQNFARIELRSATLINRLHLRKKMQNWRRRWRRSWKNGERGCRISKPLETSPYHDALDVDSMLYLPMSSATSSSTSTLHSRLNSYLVKLDVFWCPADKIRDCCCSQRSSCITSFIALPVFFPAPRSSQIVSALHTIGQSSPHE